MKAVDRLQSISLLYYWVPVWVRTSVHCWYGSWKLIGPNEVFDVIQPSVPIKPTAVPTHDFTGDLFTLLGDSIISVGLQHGCFSVCLMVSNDSQSALRLNALCALGHSVSLQAMSGATLDQSKIQRMIAQWRNNKVGVAVDLAVLVIRCF